MSKKKKLNPTLFAVKAARKASREEEIKLHGKPLNHRKVQASEKVYNRKKNKAAADEALPYFYLNRVVITKYLPACLWE